MSAILINPFIIGPPAPPQLLIDDIGQTAKGAYSVRKLRDAYAGSCLRAVRASDSAEQDIGFDGESMDWAAAITFKGASTITMKTWYDQSGSGYDLTQATAANQATIDTSAEELDFDGGDYYQAASADFSGTNKVSLFVVSRTSTNADFLMHLDHNTGGSGVQSFSVYSTVGGLIRVQHSFPTSQFNFDNGSSYTSGAFRVISGVINRDLTGADQSIGWLDGTQMSNGSSAGTSANFANATLNLGSRNASSLFFTGSMREAVIFPVALTNGERITGEDNINAYY